MMSCFGVCADKRSLRFEVREPRDEMTIFLSTSVIFYFEASQPPVSDIDVFTWRLMEAAGSPRGILPDSLDEKLFHPSRMTRAPSTLTATP